MYETLSIIFFDSDFHKKQEMWEHGLISWKKSQFSFI